MIDQTSRQRSPLRHPVKCDILKLREGGSSDYTLDFLEKCGYHSGRQFEKIHVVSLGWHVMGGMHVSHCTPLSGWEKRCVPAGKLDVDSGNWRMRQE